MSPTAKPSKHVSPSSDEKADTLDGQKYKKVRVPGQNNAGHARNSRQLHKKLLSRPIDVLLDIGKDYRASE